MRRLLLLTPLALLLLPGCPKDPPPIDDKTKADGFYLEGTSAYLKGKFPEAHEKFDQVKKLNPDDPRLPAAEGELLLAEGKLKDAVDRFEAATKIDPKRSTNWSRLGTLYTMLGEKEKAKTALDKALTLNPRDFNALETRADEALRAGRLDEGVQLLVRASEAAPDTARAELTLKAAAELTKAGRAKEALEVLEAAVKQGLESAPVFSELGDELVRDGRTEDAAKAYEQAAAADPQDPIPWELSGEAWLSLGNFELAEKAFNASLKVRPRGVVHAALARLCQKKKDEACLKAELEKALDTATGEELRETTDLADLLVSVGRGRDALMLLKAVDEEAEQLKNVELHLKTAKLAKLQEDGPTLKAACERVLSAQPDAGCP